MRTIQNGEVFMFTKGKRRERLERNVAKWQRFADVSGPMVAGLITGIQNHDSTQFDSFLVQLQDFPTVTFADLVPFSCALAADVYVGSGIQQLSDRELVELMADYTSWWIPKEYAVNVIGVREVAENRRKAGERFDVIAMTLWAFTLCAYLTPDGEADSQVQQFCLKLPPGFLIERVDDPVVPYPRKGRVDPS